LFVFYRAEILGESLPKKFSVKPKKNEHEEKSLIKKRQNKAGREFYALIITGCLEKLITKQID
jgi:hypothetical protein